MKHVMIEDNMLGRDLHIIINCTPSRFNNIVYKKTKTETDVNETDDGCYFSIIDDKGKMTSYIYLSKFGKDTASIGILTHEIYHHVYRSLKHVGIKNEETSAYVMQYFITQALSKLS